MQDELLQRYARQVMLPEMDYDGQNKLVSAHVLILGVGGLGSPAALYLAAAGIGKLTLVDNDEVELSNLQRQIVHTEANIGQNKAMSAKQTLGNLNSHITINTVTTRLGHARLRPLIEEVDAVLDCTDNFASRLLTNQVCVETGTPLISAAAIRWEGQIMVIDPMNADSACYQCVYGEPVSENLNCSQSGVMSPVVGLLGVWQALETVKVVSAVGEIITNQIHIFDGLRGQWQKLKVGKNPQCACCGRKS